MKDTVIKKKKLLELLNVYLQSLVDNTPEKVPLTNDYRATYNGEKCRCGDNEIWEHVLRFQSRQSFTDLCTRSVVFFATATNEALITAGGKEYPKQKSTDLSLISIPVSLRPRSWWFYFLRITARDDLICEIEELTTPEQILKFDTMPWDYPVRIQSLDSYVPESERISREELITAADTYWLGCEGKVSPDDVPVHPDCGRLELGEQCVQSKRNYNTVRSIMRKTTVRWQITNRRWYIADEERGLAVCIVEFRQPDGKMPGFLAAEAFKFESGLIRDIVSFLHYGTCDSGWRAEETVNGVYVKTK